MIDGRLSFDQPLNNAKTTFDIIWKIATSQGDEYTTGFLLDYSYYKLIATDLSKQQKLDADPKATN